MKKKLILLACLFLGFGFAYLHMRNVQMERAMIGECADETMDELSSIPLSPYSQDQMWEFATNHVIRVLDPLLRGQYQNSSLQTEYNELSRAFCNKYGSPFSYRLSNVYNVNTNAISEAVFTNKHPECFIIIPALMNKFYELDDNDDPEKYEQIEWYICQSVLQQLRIDTRHDQKIVIQ